MKAVLSAVAVVAALSIVGCKSNTNKPSSEPAPAVVDLTPAPAPAAAEPTPAPVEVQPAPAVEAPAIKEAPAVAGKEPITGNKYTVQKGDTLYSIAVRKYGKGGAATLKKIEKANKGLKPETLKAGQTITLP